MRLASFFKNMTNLITLSLEPAIGRLNDTLTLGIKDAAEGLPISNPVIESIHRLTASPSMYMLLAEIIAKTYYNISKELIMPMASCLDQMLLLRKQDKVAFAREVDEKRTELKSVTYKAAEQIKAIIAQETANWSSKVNLRLKEIDDDVKRLLPVGESGDNVITEGDDKEDDAVMGLVKLAFFS
ncbi:hypothetical protein SISSUDRAFT_677451 [Sistotremastrum suecicum HHB10207 ss-3]|uniref:Uncharacterized protein n=1 Tax=Sistotremastrum suecicum HHB10207 ss-3 TaxID=1314776 RepID=A0A166DZR8_9AGAM|nr:hypothetical protein SISSUDRAFT_677451 [Sistotremastrum suecicum HHB10207 ss-3]